MRLWRMWRLGVLLRLGWSLCSVSLLFNQSPLSAKSYSALGNWIGKIEHKGKERKGKDLTKYVDMI